MANLLSEFGEALFWRDPLPEIHFYGEDHGEEAQGKGEEEASSSVGEELGLGENWNDGKCRENSEDNQNPPSCINMVLVQFTLEEHAVAAPEVFDAVNEMERLVWEKSATFLASEWVSDYEWKMEAVMGENDEAKALVGQLNNTSWHPSLSLNVTLNAVPSLSKSHTEKTRTIGKRVEAPPLLPSPNSVSPFIGSDSGKPRGKFKKTVDDDLGGLMRKKKVSGRTSREKVEQHMLNYIIDKIRHIDEKMRQAKEEHNLIGTEIEDLDRDLSNLEEEFDELSQNCSSRAGVVFPSMDIRLKVNVVNPDVVHLDYTSEDKLCPDFNKEDGGRVDEEVVERDVQEGAEIRVEGKDDVKETLEGKTKVESLLEGGIMDVQNSNFNAKSGLRGTLEEGGKEEKLVVEENAESVEEVEKADEETGREGGGGLDVEVGGLHVEADGLDVEVDGLFAGQRRDALVSKGAEVIIDCDSE